MFTSDDFKTRQWGNVLEKSGFEIVQNERWHIKLLDMVARHARILIRKFICGQRVHVFIFRYLNDDKHLRVSIELLIRDIITIMVSLLTRTRVIWLMHNIDRETIVHYPGITKMRRAIVNRFAHYVLVTDRLLIAYAVQH
ncbi:MAG: hypothetical protein ACNA8K_15295, partial [Cyclonatronaceae bacterium]